MATTDTVPAASAGAAPDTGPLDPGMLRRLAGRVAVDGDREQLPVVAPFTGRPFATVPRGTPDDVTEAVARARHAQPAWARLPFEDRGRVLLRFHDLLFDRQGEVLDLIQMETGKARRWAFEEVGDAAIVARYYAHSAAKHLRSRRRQGFAPVLTQVWEHHHPRGVAGFIVPWNYPLPTGISDVMPALMAGNGVVVKADRQTSFTLLWLLELMAEAGLPEGLAQVVTGEGPELGPSLIESVDYLCFTGSTATGRIVGAQAAERLVACTLELGGKNAMLVLPDANVRAAARGAVSGVVVSGGQTCVSMERIYVHEPLFDEFVDQFGLLTGSLNIGPGFDWDIDVGSLVSERQLQKVRGHVDEAVAKGATVVTGGRHRPDLGPFFFEPTVLTGVTEDMTLAREETFGPVVSVYPVATIDEAVDRANDSPYGLNFSVWTRDTTLGRHVASRLHAGTVNVNESYAAAWGSTAAPMGGMKDSGLGRRHGAEGILKYTESQTVAVQRLHPIGPPPWLSYGTFARIITPVLKSMRRLPFFD